ncbi:MULTISPECIES: YebC/PmpR family DNA-binding transcriptional regulator [Halopseudomonas]|jgi:YebC/PmpR family DNA-binding regulatory protein|uniref:Probable transcriptional regulatory protein RED13_002729 n=1 Tax=Halopseudomonas formosensis TaxID=1002526 RepID=A0A1I6B7H5_9GAMM|nr:YebC/PmpR family DNA-binding transcriptional regulator [Halopseudomonas formosensis]MDX9688275.1 YebC/PmpR family DNA-binding transcriptional regulator [Halopseudomonas formosensis]NLC01273.1 YebC/PmpR family DNA-binding transcriptional regulator [Halopseudomonas formosensis]SFQ76896.1 DNA-binding regulatory protein, YebC/PmpR family [Halopseudomonas formosensis]
MAGHSKWANIKHRKAAQDAKRGKIFTKLIRELTVAAKLGGPEPADNPRLRSAVDKALTANMTRDTIDRAIARGAGSNDADNVEELVYEGYGAGGVAILVEAMTDNRNRTVAEVRHAFNKCGGNLGTEGSVAYLFTRRGQISYAPGVDEDALMEAALEAGAEDVVTNDDGSIDVLTAFEDFGAVKDALDAAGFTSEAAEVSMIPSTTTELDLDTAQKVIRLVDMLEDLDDVQNVYSNADIPDDVLAQME